MNQKGDISISMIVIAAIGVIVLSLVAALVLQSGGDLQDAKSCSNVGTCAQSCEAIPGSIPGARMDCAQGQRCCIQTS